jgi:hypothetical protein
MRLRRLNNFGHNPTGPCSHYSWAEIGTPLRKVFILLAGITMALSGCALSQYHWREDVALPSGKTVVVQRSVKLGNPLNQEIQDLKFGPPTVGYVLRIPVPGTSTKIRWESDQNLIPLAIGIVGEKVYLAASPKNCPAFEKWGRPTPPYVFFRSEGEGWDRISVNEFPTEISHANLMISPRQDRIQSGYADPYIVSQSNMSIDSSRENIYRAGMKGFEGCLR